MSKESRTVLLETIRVLQENAPLSKLLVSPLVTPTIVRYITPPLRSLDCYSLNALLVGTTGAAPLAASTNNMGHGQSTFLKERFKV